jgi:hypothetical protein
MATAEPVAGDLVGLAAGCRRTLDGVEEATVVPGGLHLVAREGLEVTSVEVVEPDLEAVSSSSPRWPGRRRWPRSAGSA